MSPVLAATLVAVLYVLHQDIWFWRTARPLVFGFLPIGLAYHAAFTLASSLLLWVLVRRAWPSHLEAAASPGSPPE
jgi:Protein of unknown function (DUF3311)